MSEQIKQQVMEWIDSGCNYEMGVQLYFQYGKNNILKRDFPGKAHKHQEKIVYELCKSVGIDYFQLKKEDRILINNEPAKAKQPVPVTRTPAPIRNTPATTQPAPAVEMPETLLGTKISEYPPIIRRVIAEYAEAFQERGKAHRIMTEMPEGNSQALKTKRAEMFELVKGLSEKLQRFFFIRAEFERTGFVPAEEDIWPAPKEKAKAELPNDPEELRKMKKNQQSANVKDQNMLDYQSEKKGDKPRPMPQGPKRMKLESRIKARLAMIEQIEYKLLSL